MEPISSIILTMAAKAFVNTLAGKVTTGLFAKLKGEPAKRAYKQAIGKAIQYYAAGERLVLAQPLLNKKGILSDPEVAEELSQIIRFGREPDVRLIGEKWQRALTNPPKDRNFTREAQFLLGHLENELRSSEIFRPVFEAKDLNAIAVSAKISPEVLANIEAKLSGLVELLTGRFQDLADSFGRISPDIRHQIRYSSAFIEDKTRGFVGRQWVFAKVERFLKENPRGYFFIMGDPGIGKSALAAQMIKNKGYVHHFNSHTEGICKASSFLTNICSQLIAAYKLDYTVLPPGASNDAGFLKRLLNQVSLKRKPGEACVIVVDALDEVDMTGMPEGANPLYLPVSVPQGVYIVATMRLEDDKRHMPFLQCERDKIVIHHDSSDNLKDVSDFLQASCKRPGIAAYIQAQRMDAQRFTGMMVEKSEGNFIYLHYMLQEIEHGVFKDTGLDAIPTGLNEYYRGHWIRMRGRDENAWFDYKLPVLVALSVMRKSVSIDLIKSISKVRRTSRVREVLQEWSAFLHEEEVDYERGKQKRYRLYHTSFFDFIASRQEIADERVDLQTASAQAADAMLGGPVWET